MNDIINEIISTYLLPALATFILGFFAWLGTQLKKVYTEKINTKTKKDVAKTCIKAVEQIYKDIHGEEKLNKALEAMTEMLKEKGIEVSDLEAHMLLEAAVFGFNKGLTDNEE